MKIAYCANLRLPTERAHGHQVAQVCDALAGLGHDVTVYAPFRRNPAGEDFASYYGINPSVRVTYLGSFDPINRAWLPGPAGLWILNALLRRHLSRALPPEKPDIVYTRSPALLPVLLRTGAPVILELHRLPRRGRHAFVRRCNACALVVCLTSLMKDALVRQGVPPEKIVVEGDAYDPALFADPPSREQAGKEWRLDPSLPVIGYTGQLVSMGLSKGVPELLQALALLHEQGFAFQALIAGGPADAAKKFHESLPAGLRPYVHFPGIIPHVRIAGVMAACDVLVYPAPKSDHPYYRRDVSPLKIFEYMAAGRPVVCADLPPLHDVLDASLVRFCEPGDARSCADAIRWVLEQPEEAEHMVRAASVKVRRHTWEERMRRIIASLSRTPDIR